MIKKLFKQMLLTQILSAMTVMICMLIDSIMISRFLGIDSMTAYGLASPVLLVFAAFGSMLSAGIQVLGGKTMGSGDTKATDACFTASVVLAGGVSLVGLVLVLIFSGPICTLLGAGEPVPGNDVFFLTQDYLKGFIIGAPAFIFAQIMVPYMQMSGNRTRLVVAVAAMTVADIVFDLVNVFAIKGGTFGMGLASSLSYYIAFAIGIVYFFKKECIFKFRPKGFKWRTCFELVKYGIPTVVNQISLVLLVFLLNKVLLDVGGNHAVASYSVISSTGNICYSFGSGIAAVALMLSSIFYADEDRTSLRSLVKTMSFYAIVIDAVVIIAVFALAPALAVLFLPDNVEARDMATLGVRLFSLCLVPCALNTTFKNYYQGTNRTALTQIISVFQNFLFTAIFAVVLSRFFGTTGVWISFFCGETVTFILISAYVFFKNKKVAVTADAYALLKDDFGAGDDECLELTVTKENEAVEASKKASDFCRMHGQSPKDSTLIALCVEEMVNNIVAHGFKSDNKQHSIDIRIIIKDGTRVIRIRDNCQNFDPVNYMKLHQTDDPTSHIGIRMVMGMTKSANYVNSLGLNNLTLVL